MLLECLGGSDYQSRLLAKAWISQCFHYSDLNRILDPLLIQLLHPSSARKLELPHLSSNGEIDTRSRDYSREEDTKESDSEADYSTAESEQTTNGDQIFGDVKAGEEKKKKTDCQNELYYWQEYDTNRSKYLWQIILSMMQADPTPFIRFIYLID